MKIQFRQFEKYLIKKPVLWLFVLTLLVNLPAVFFARGYGMHDDHFGPIEQPWAVIHNPDLWHSRTTPHAHSIFYPLLHYILFKILYALGITDPQEVMLVVRFLHSLYSTITIIFLYKILSVNFEQKIALRSVLFLVVLWIMPFLCVRNLIEMVCIPPLAVGFYLLVKPNTNWKNLALSALFFALAFAFRYQTLMMSGTVLLILVFKKQFKDAIVFGGSLLLFALLIQGSVDVFAWGYPFASFAEYVWYNFTHRGDYTTGPIYRYFLLLLGIFIPPLSFFIIKYFFTNFNKHIYIVLPILVFFVFHSIFPNKQERFILPIVPFVFTIGMANFIASVENGEIFAKRRKYYNLVLILFWLFNIPLFVALSFNYGKKTRCESLYFLSKQHDVRGVFQITGKLGPFKPPEFYLNKYGTPVVEIPRIDSLGKFTADKTQPNYAVIYGEAVEIDSLKISAEKILGRKMVFLAEIKPSLVDWIVYKLNPKYNKNQTARIYKIADRNKPF
ncbi:MAG: glycosyltransferase family 39 protein [Candidatus Kapaibacteriota bacterium]